MLWWPPCKAHKHSTMHTYVHSPLPTRLCFWQQFCWLRENLPVLKIQEPEYPIGCNPTSLLWSTEFLHSWENGNFYNLAVYTVSDCIRPCWKTVRSHKLSVYITEFQVTHIKQHKTTVIERRTDGVLGISKRGHQLQGVCHTMCAND